MTVLANISRNLTDRPTERTKIVAFEGAEDSCEIVESRQRREYRSRDDVGSRYQAATTEDKAN
jgi:hypothetical protein